MSGPWEQFQAPQQSSGGGPWEDYQPKNQPAMSMAEAPKALLQNELEGQFLAQQRVSPHVFSGKVKPQKLGELEDWDTGPAYRDAGGQIRPINAQTDFVAVDPETGKRSVFARHTAAAGSEAQDLTNESKLISLARTIVPGLAVGPVAGIQRTANAANAANTAEALAGNVGTKTGAALASERATNAVRDEQAFNDLNVRRFGPAFNQGPVASVARQMTETPLVGAPLKNALDESLRGTATAAENVAAKYGSAATPETAGNAIREGITRFKDARPAEIVERAAEGYTPEQLSQIIAAPARDTSLKTKQAALYQRAWDLIPEEMQAGRSVEGLPRVLGQMPNSRALLQEIEGRNLRMINASASGAENAAKPVAGGGLAGRMVDAMMNTKWPAALQSMRDIRSNFRRLASGVSDTEKNTMQLSDLDRLQSAITKDMVGLMERNVGRYTDLARTASDADLLRLAQNANLPAAIAKNPQAVKLYFASTARNIQRGITEFKRADMFTRTAAQRMQTIEKLFNAPSAESLYRNVASAALSKGRGDLEKLRVLRRTLSSDELGDVAAAVIRQLGEPIGSARGVVQEVGFSPQSFTTRWNNMAPEARALLFGGEHAKAVDDLMRVSSRLANVEALANVSRSGTNALNMTGLLGSVGLTATGNWPTALGIAGGGLFSSFLLSRPAYTRWAVEYAKLRAAALRAPVDTTGGRLIAHVQRLGQLAERDPLLLPVYRAVAKENGIDEGGDKREPVQR